MTIAMKTTGALGILSVEKNITKQAILSDSLGNKLESGKITCARSGAHQIGFLENFILQGIASPELTALFTGEWKVEKSALQTHCDEISSGLSPSLRTVRDLGRQLGVVAR